MRSTIRINDKIYRRTILDPDNMKTLMQGFGLKSEPVESNILRKFGNPMQMKLEDLNKMAVLLDLDVQRFFGFVVSTDAPIARQRLVN